MALSSWSVEGRVNDGIVFQYRLHLVLFREPDLNPLTRFSEWGEGGLFFIVELHLVLFGEINLNPVTPFLRWGEGVLRMGLFFIVDIYRYVCLVLFGDS